MKRQGTLLTIAVCCLTMIAIGIMSMISFLYASQEMIFQENDTHLMDIAWSADYHLKQTIEKSHEELSYLVHMDEVLQAEEALSTIGDEEALKKALKNSLPMLSGVADDILVRKNGTVLLCMKAGQEKGYCVENDGNGDSFLSCRNEEGTEYWGITASSADGTLEYVLLREANQFLEQEMESSIYHLYHIILYEEESGLLLQKKQGKSYCERMNSEALYEKGDKYRVMLSYQEKESYGYGEYLYKDEQGKRSSCRMAAMSNAEACNQIFTIGVCENVEELVGEVKNMQYCTLGAVLLLLVGTAGLAFTMLYNRRRRTEMIQQLEDLEKRNQLNADYLEQQKELAHHQRLEVVGTLTAGIAHEFNNLLTPIMGYSLMLLEKFSTEDEESYDSILEIYNASQKAKTIVAGLSNLTRKSRNEEKQSVSPDRLVEKVRMLADSACPNNIKTVLELKAGDATMQGDETRFSQMLLNLVLNACQSMEDKGGTLSISTGVQGNQVWIKVADTGTGIPPELIEKIFDPFFTTKESGKGTGLGLAIVQNIVQDADGTIDVENLPQGGCCFTVLLNRDDKLGDHYYSKAVISDPYATNGL